LLCPLIGYIDATQIDKFSRFSVEPFIFTPAILNYKRRCKADVWRPFGYVQQLKSNIDSDEHLMSGPGKTRNFHAQLTAMLETLRKSQTGEDIRLQNVPICLFGEIKVVDLICPILFIAADTPAADKLCSHFQSYTGKIQRPTVSCDIGNQYMNNPYHPCNFVEWEPLNNIATNGTEAQRKSVSQHLCKNAFSDILIGHPRYKIFGSVPTDPLHSLRKGIIERSQTILFQCMTAKQRNQFDLLAKTFHKTHRQTA
jgi:hypothetical protein